MSLITVHRKQVFKIGIPYWIYINGRPICIMRGKEVNINIPAGEYELGIRILFQLFKWQFHIGGSKRITINYNERKHLHITDHERIWNILFDIDMVLWIAEFFITLPHPWALVYKIISNGFFAIWIIRIWIIRKRYLQIKE